MRIDPDGAVRVANVLNGKEQGDERICRPIEQSGGEAMMLRERQPFPLVLRRNLQKGSCHPLKIIEQQMLVFFP